MTTVDDLTEAVARANAAAKRAEQAAARAEELVGETPEVPEEVPVSVGVRPERPVDPARVACEAAGGSWSTGSFLGCVFPQAGPTPPD